MKTLDELGISPGPWETTDFEFFRDEDAALASAAPEMYECLLEAIEDKCRKCKASWYGECVTTDGKDCEMVAKWKSVLAKAAGEETT